MTVGLTESSFWDEGKNIFRMKDICILFGGAVDLFWCMEVHKCVEHCAWSLSSLRDGLCEVSYCLAASNPPFHTC